MPVPLLRERDRPLGELASVYGRDELAYEGWIDQISFQSR